MDDEWYAKDRWGVPVNMFGAVPEDHYGVVGRITLVSALLEQRLHDLYCALAREPQTEKAGEPGTALITALHRHLHRLPAEHQEEARAALTVADDALRRRHEVVHSLWPHTGAAEIRGWRGVPERKRADPDRPFEWTTLHTGHLPAVLADLLDAVRRCTALLTWA